MSLCECCYVFVMSQSWVSDKFSFFAIIVKSQNILTFHNSRKNVRVEKLNLYHCIQKNKLFNVTFFFLLH